MLASDQTLVASISGNKGGHGSRRPRESSGYVKCNRALAAPRALSGHPHPDIRSLPACTDTGNGSGARVADQGQMVEPIHILDGRSLRPSVSNGISAPSAHDEDEFSPDHTEPERALRDIVRQRDPSIGEKGPPHRPVSDARDDGVVLHAIVRPDRGDGGGVPAPLAERCATEPDDGQRKTATFTVWI